MSMKSLPSPQPGDKQSAARPAENPACWGAVVNAKPATDRTDEREQLVNGLLCGPIQQVSVPEAAITSLGGMLLDFDPDRLHPSLAPADVLSEPTKVLVGV